MATDELPGFTVTLDCPGGTLRREVVGRRIYEPTPDVDPDATLVPLLHELARRIAPAWPATAERFDVTDDWSREMHSTDTRRGGYRAGTASQNVAVGYRYVESEQEMFPVPRYESRHYTVVGLPDGWRLAAHVDREWLGGKLVTAEVQVRGFVPIQWEDAVKTAVRDACEADTRRPRVLDLVPQTPADTNTIAWQRVVKAGHAGTDVTEVLRGYRPGYLSSWERAGETDPRFLGLVGDCHRTGCCGVPRDADLAAEWYRKAVAGGDLTATTSLAELLDERGEAGEATALLRTAAEAGEARAQSLLGKRYFSGTGGVPKDEVEARRWFERGADGDDGRSQNNLATLLLKEGNTRAAMRWLRRAAERGEPVAALNVGKLLWEPRARNIAPDYEEAMIWFHQSARRGNANAQLRLGQEYVRGEGCPKDLEAARHWFLQAARQGQPLAQLNVGVMYEKAEGGPFLFDDAELWFRKAAEAGNETAKRYHTDLLRDRAADLARRAEAGELSYSRVPSASALNSLIYTQRIDPADPTVDLPQYGWLCGWKLLTFVMPDPDTVELGVREDEGQTEGRAMFSPLHGSYTLAEFLADGPPGPLLDHSDLTTLVAVMECAIADLGRPEPDWLHTLRLHEAAAHGSVDVIRDRCTRTTATAMVADRDALYWACRWSRVDAVESLLGELGADPLRRYTYGPRPPIPALLVAAVATTEPAEVAVLAALRRGGADPNAPDAAGVPPLVWLLHSASSDGVWRPLAFDWLLANGADPDAGAPLAAVAGSKFLPEVKHDLAGKLFAAGATVAALPEPLRERFRTALRSWHPDAWRAGLMLATRPIPNSWVDNRELLFRDPVEGTEAVICEVGTGSLGNQPYAPDEHFSFDATLLAAGRTLVAKVVKERRTVLAAEETVLWFESVTAGRVWVERDAPANLSAAVELVRRFG